MITQVKGAGMIKNRGLTGLSITKNTIDWLIEWLTWIDLPRAYAQILKNKTTKKKSSIYNVIRRFNHPELH
jgi:hypothetical protein